MKLSIIDSSMGSLVSVVRVLIGCKQRGDTNHIECCYHLEIILGGVPPKRKSFFGLMVSFRKGQYCPFEFFSKFGGRVGVLKERV